jgi:hypothetical protein
MSILHESKISTRIFKIGVYVLLWTLLLRTASTGCQEESQVLQARERLLNQLLAYSLEGTRQTINKGAAWAIFCGVAALPFLPHCLCAPVAGGVIGFALALFPSVSQVSVGDALDETPVSYTECEYDEFFGSQGIVYLKNYKDFPETRILLLIRERYKNEKKEFPKPLVQKILSYRALTERGMNCLSIREERLKTIDQKNSLVVLLNNFKQLEELRAQRKITFKQSDAMSISCRPRYFDMSIIQDASFQKKYPDLVSLAGASQVPIYFYPKNFMGTDEKKQAFVQCYRFEDDPEYALIPKSSTVTITMQD